MVGDRKLLIALGVLWPLGSLGQGAFQTPERALKNIRWLEVCEGPWEPDTGSLKPCEGQERDKQRCVRPRKPLKPQPGSVIIKKECGKGHAELPWCHSFANKVKNSG